MNDFYNRDFPTALRKTFHRMDEMLEDEVKNYEHLLQIHHHNELFSCIPDRNMTFNCSNSASFRILLIRRKTMTPAKAAVLAVRRLDAKSPPLRRFSYSRIYWKKKRCVLTFLSPNFLLVLLLVSATCNYNTTLTLIYVTLSFSTRQNKGEKKIPKAPLATLMPNYEPSFPTALNTANAVDEGDKYVNDADRQCHLSEHRFVVVEAFCR